MQSRVKYLLVSATVLGALGFGLAQVKADTVDTQSNGTSESETVVSSTSSSEMTKQWGHKYVMLGGSLTPAQRQETLDDLKVSTDDGSNYDVETVNGDDLVKYLGGQDFNSQSPAWSSAKVVQGKEDSGVVVNITTPKNITSKTNETYANAAITAGAKDVDITVASVVPIDGSGALTGVYKALEMEGYKLDQGQIDAGQKEVDTLSAINGENKDKDGFNDKKLNVAVADAKEQVGQEKAKTKEPLSKDKIDGIVTKALETQGIDSAVTPEQKDQIVDLVNTIQKSGALDNKQALEQLSKYKDEVMANAKNIFSDVENSEQAQGFFAKVEQFFKGIGEWFSNL